MNRLKFVVAVFALVAAPVLSQAVESLLLPDPLDSRSTAGRFAARIAELTREEQIHNALGNTTQANLINVTISYLQGLQSGSIPIPAATTNEVHAVSFYEGAPAPLGQPRTAQINVTQTGSPISLFLNSYETISWTISPLPPGVQLAQIVVVSYDPQILNGLPPGVPVTIVDQNSGGTYYGDPTDLEGRVDTAAECIARFGALPTTFTGSYTAPGATFEVGPGSSDWRDQWALSLANTQVAALCGLTIGNLVGTYDAQTFIPLLTGGGVEVVFASPFQVQSPAIVTLNSVTQYTFDFGFNVFVLNSSGPASLNLSNLGTTNLPPVPLGMPALSFPKGLTYDSMRHRLLVSTLGGTGYLYGFDLATSTWSVIASLQNQDLTALCYDASTDLTYALDPGTFGGSLRLNRYDATGALVSFTTLGLNTWGWAFDSFQLYILGTNLVAVGPPKVLLGSITLRHTFVINPANGDILFSRFLVG